MIDTSTETWQQLARYVESRLIEHHERIEGPLTERQTDAHRGAIQELKLLLAQAGRQTTPEIEPDGTGVGPQDWFGVFG